MDVRLDQTGASEAPAGVINLPDARQPGRDRDDLAAGNTDIDEFWPVRQADIAYDQVHAIRRRSA